MSLYLLTTTIECVLNCQFIFILARKKSQIDNFQARLNEDFHEDISEQRGGGEGGLPTPSSPRSQGVLVLSSSGL